MSRLAFQYATVHGDKSAQAFRVKKAFIRHGLSMMIMAPVTTHLKDTKYDYLIREEENIFPFQEQADVMFNSALIYELSVLKQYAEPLLFGIDREAPEYLEAKRLLKFLDYFLGVDSTVIPDNSLLREFIGGGCFRL